MEWLLRLQRVVRVQVTQWVGTVEDPETLLEKAIEELEGQVIALRRGLAEAIASFKSSERHIASHQAQAQRWYERAQLAIDKGQDALARDALVHRQAYLSHADSLQQQLSEQSTAIAKLKQDLQVLERKLLEAKSKKSLYIARLRSAIASQRVQELLGDSNGGAYPHIFERIEAKILELEAHSELSVDPLEENFRSLEGDRQVDAEFLALKARQTSPLPPADSGDRAS